MSDPAVGPLVGGLVYVEEGQADLGWKVRPDIVPHPGAAIDTPPAGNQDTAPKSGQEEHFDVDRSG